MNDYEDDEFNRIEMESRVRQMAVRYAMEQAKEPSPIPFVTAEDWEKLNKEHDAVPPQSNT
jgi:hypothetical protein